MAGLAEEVHCVLERDKRAERVAHDGVPFQRQRLRDGAHVPGERLYAEGVSVLHRIGAAVSSLIDNDQAEPVAKGVRRVTALTGPRALARIRETEDILKELVALLKTPQPQDLPRRVTKESALRRNEVVAALTDELVVAYARPGGAMEALLAEARRWGIPCSLLVGAGRSAN